MANMFLTLKTQNCGQVKGETTQKGFEDYIEIESWGLGVSNTHVVEGGGSGASGKARFQDMHFTAKLEKAGVTLLKCCAAGDHVQEAVIKNLREAAGARQVYLTITLKDGLVSSINAGGSGSRGDQLPMAEFSLSFAEIEMEYKPQKEDGSLGNPHSVHHDLRKGK
jgi:type VI secretion system secreted protein Hcp